MIKFITKLLRKARLIHQLDNIYTDESTYLSTYPFIVLVMIVTQFVHVFVYIFVYIYTRYLHTRNFYFFN